ncbi:hypothetical protein SNOG_06629 [Parastagonospora nodorum SN15]|uniref:Hydantoinase/oxoprolinase N-terminal domain-containing protein n=1 Tax=Phaeosphaeria nodorum (strain SN15 / ATCC MYA-4574 / FGSC 10173) TaxID=321614 RepID=Q0UNN5_PHANO|nr:hypothetical protein SNOG_06629 [Parastagonospora nodorum SN15]EAT86460.2 hypothetical protein SNOG_06629 [Parastagonospora nodorum SN15]
MSLYRIGVDVGGTNTDAAILDLRALNDHGRGVLASHKASTTRDITSGVESAIRVVLQDSKVEQNRVLSVTIGTTHFINALVEADARSILDGGVYYLDGGLEIDGREIAPLNPAQVRTAARDILASGIKVVALIGVFSPLDHGGLHEEECKKIFYTEAPELQVTCSHDIGPTGFLERENATILNTAILRTSRRVKRGFKRAMARLHLSCPLYLSQNDGTLLDADSAADFPVKTFASGPTNSMTGAAFLAGLDCNTRAAADDSIEPQIIVVDIGGTTTDVCALSPSGFPRQAPGFVEVAGVRTAFSMPEVVSIGLGGGSKVYVDRQSEIVTIGPASVGHHIRQEAKVFGGQTLTSSDIVVALGKARLGDAALVKDVLSPDLLESARKQLKRMLEGIIEQMKVSDAPVHVLLVGGGALLVTENLDGVDKCVQPIHQGAANAVGAAIAKISGEVDVVEIPGGRSEKEIIESVCEKAVGLAVQRGASREDVQIVEVNKMPLQYMPNGAVRIQIRATGPLATPNDFTPLPSPPLSCEDEFEVEEGEKVGVPSALDPTYKPVLHVDLDAYRPQVQQGIWYVSEVDLELIATGCGVLGTEGGGPTHHEYLKSLHALRTGGDKKMRIISPESLNDDDILCFGSWYGSSSVINERIAGGNEIAAGINAVNKVVGNESFDGLFIDEIGGGNGLSAFPTGVHFDVPIVDGDAMGRAFPTMYHGKSRTQVIYFRLMMIFSSHFQRFNICAGKLLYSGKVIDVRRHVGGGYTMGSVTIAPFSDSERDSTAVPTQSYISNDRFMIIPFQNEYLYAALRDSEGSEESQEIICTVPDLISILGQDGEGIGSQDLRYGLRVNVIALPAHPLWKTEQGIKVGGPEGFGLNVPVLSIDNQFTEAQSVIKDFGK